MDPVTTRPPSSFSRWKPTSLAALVAVAGVAVLLLSGTMLPAVAPPSSTPVAGPSASHLLPGHQASAPVLPSHPSASPTSPGPSAPSTSAAPRPVPPATPTTTGRSDNTIIATVDVGGTPEALAFDSGNGAFYIADRSSDLVEVLDGANNTVLPSIPVGNDPAGVAYDSSNGELFVANSGSSTVSIINGADEEVLASVVVGDSPIGIVYDAGNGEVYVADSGSNSVTVLSSSTGDVVTTLAVENDPTAIAWDSDTGTVYVANTGSSTLSAIATATNTVRATIPVGEAPVSLAYDDVDQDLYVADEGSNSVSVIAGSTGTVATTISVGPAPEGVSYNPGNGNLYVAASDANDVGVISGQFNTEIGTIAVGSGPHALGYDTANGQIYIADANSGEVSVLSPTGGSWVIATIPLNQNYPEAVGYNSANGDAYMLDEAGDTVAVIPSRGPATNTVTAYIPVGNNPAAMAVDNVTGDGTIYVADAGSNEVSVIAGGTNTVVATIPVGSDPRGITFDRANGYVYVNDEGSGTATVIAGYSVIGTIAGVNGGGEHTTATYDASNGDIYMCTGSGMTVISGATDTVIAYVYAGTSCYTTGYDSGNGNVYFSNAGSNIYEISGATNKIIAIIGGISSTEGIDYDYANGDLYVGDENGGNTMTVINATTNTVVAYLSVGVLSDGTVYDNVDADNYVANEQSKTASVIATVSVTSVAVTPTSVTIPTSGYYNFSAAATCSGGPCPPGLTYTWGLLNPALGSVSPPYGTSTTFTAGTTTGTETLQVTALLNNLPTTGTATITIIPGLASVAVTPPSASVPVNGTQAFSVSPTCSGGPCPAGTLYAWSLNNTLGSITPLSGPTTTFSAGPLGGLTTLTVLAHLNGQWASASATIGVIPTLSAVFITPSPATVSIGGSQVFNATLRCSGGGCAFGAVYTWSLSGGIGGSLNTSSGSTVLFVPGTLAGTATLTVSATLLSVTHVSAPTTITVVPGLSSISATPTSVAVPTSRAQLFSASAVCVGGPCPSGIVYSWHVNPLMGNLTYPNATTTTFTAGSRLGTTSLFVNATLAGLTRAAFPVVINVVPGLASLTVTPAPALVLPGGTVNFTALPACTGAPCPYGAVYTWTLNNSLGQLNSSTSATAQFVAGHQTGTSLLRVAATLDGITKPATPVYIAITTNPAPPVISSISVSPNPVRVGEPTTVAVVVSGGVTPFAYTYTGLPPGCPSLDAPSITCGPTSPGNYTVTVTVIDDAGRSALASAPLAVLGPILPFAVTLASNSTNTSEGGSFVLTAKVVGGLGPFVYHWFSSGVNASLAPSGPSWTVTEAPAGTLSFRVFITDGQGVEAWTNTVNITVAAVVQPNLQAPLPLPGWSLLAIVLFVNLAMVVAAAGRRFRQDREEAEEEAGTAPATVAEGPAPELPAGETASYPAVEGEAPAALGSGEVALAPVGAVVQVSEFQEEGGGGVGGRVDHPMGDCPRCGAPVGADGLCPSCGLASAPFSEDVVLPGPPPSVPPMEGAEVAPGPPPESVSKAPPTPPPVPVPPPPATSEAPRQPAPPKDEPAAPPPEPIPPPPQAVEVPRPPEAGARPPSGGGVIRPKLPAPKPKATTATQPAPSARSPSPSPSVPPKTTGGARCQLCDAPLEGDYCPNCGMHWFNRRK